MFLLTLMLLHEIHYQYLNPDKLEKLHSYDHPICVACYKGLRKWICPNPRQEARAEGAEAIYQAGFFTVKQVFCLSADDFKDPKNWTS